MSKGDQVVPEEWRTIEEYPAYEVSSHGRVRRGTAATGSAAAGTWVGRIRKPFLGKGELKYRYPRILFRRNGKLWFPQIHTLVLKAFCGPRPPGMVCRHLDGDIYNTRLDNLCWGTHKENEADKSRHGRRTRGEASSLSKLKESQVVEIKRRLLDYKWGDVGRLASEYGVSRTAISFIKQGVNWSHVVVTR